MNNYSSVVLIAGLGIITGTAYLNVLQESQKIYAMMVMLTFWMVIIYIFTLDKGTKDQIQVFVAIFMIFISTIYSDIKYISILGWLYLGYLMGLVNGQINKNKMCLSMTAAIFMIVSDNILYPLQQKECKVDGPAMALKGIAWSLFAYNIM